MEELFSIPRSEPPVLERVPEDNGEPLVNLSEYFGGEIIVQPSYFLQGIPHAVNYCLLRASAAERLKTALAALPEELTFLVYDSWRPIAVQQALYDTYFQQLKRQYGDMLTTEALSEKVLSFVSKPSRDPFLPSVHNTGGAIDLTIAARSDGKPLPMGTAFDDFRPIAYTAFFEGTQQTEFRDNRRLLYRVMTDAGFTNLPSEWWHFDYVTPFWSYYRKQPAFYCGTTGEHSNEE